MFVLTIDLRDSRRGGAATVTTLRDELQETLPRPLLGWDVSAGDELQALYDDAAAAVHAALSLTDTRAWHIGLGVGAVDTPLGNTVRESTGPAFVAAREAVSESKERCGPVVAGGDWAARAGTVLDLVCAVRARRTPAGTAASALADEGRTQQEMAADLGIAQSSVSRRLSAALWHEEHAVRETLVALLELADGHGVGQHDDAADVCSGGTHGPEHTRDDHGVATDGDGHERAPQRGHSEEDA